MKTIITRIIEERRRASLRLPTWYLLIRIAVMSAAAVYFVYSAVKQIIWIWSPR